MLDAILLANSQEETRRMRPTVCSFAAAAFAALVLTGCDADSPPARPGEDGSEQSVDDSEARLIPQTAGFDQVRALALDPHSAELPDDSLLAGQIRRGFDIITNTPVHAPRYSGNAMTCANCHLNAGQRERALPLVGVAAVFPVSRAREGRLFSLEDRIRGCFMRSMNGTAPPYDSEELLAVSAYIHWLSRGQSLGESPPWRGLNTIPEESRLAIDRLDPVLGESIFRQQCTMCHGVDGQGVDIGGVKPGPLWGDSSWNDGAGLSRVYTLAGYLRYTMPLTAPGTLTDEQAQHVAAYINAQERPTYPDKANDYPAGAPVDAVYYPRYDENPVRARLLEASGVDR